MTSLLLTALTVVPATVAAILEFAFNVRISERHHSHHDTYGMSVIMTSMVVTAMVFMAVLGVVLAWLCHMEVFRAEEAVILGFFSAFELVMFVMWLAMRRYQVSTYDDHMEVRPFVGPTRTIPYDRIERLRWTGSRYVGGGRSLSIVVDGKVVAVLVGMIDLDQVVLRINRNDVLDVDNGRTQRRSPK